MALPGQRDERWKLRTGRRRLQPGRCSVGLRCGAEVTGILQQLSSAAEPSPGIARESGAEPTLPPGDLWVFGYGSLMWNPGFTHDRRAQATIHGCHRALCVWSWVHRGTRAAPGLVLGLDRGGSCRGIAFRVPAPARHATIAYLYGRELVTDVYLPAARVISVAGVGTVCALTFVVDRRHPQYAGRLSNPTAAAVVRRARGRGGANLDYINSTLACLEALDIRCSQLERVRGALLGR